jgi:hypothetical protein
MAEVVAWIALVVSIIGLSLGWSADGTTRSVLKQLEQSHRREADRVDRFIQDLTRHPRR